MSGRDHFQFPPPIKERLEGVWEKSNETLP
jgi:hypothetical protein